MIFNHKLVVSIVMCIFWATTPVISEECYEEVETAMKSFDGYDGYYSIIKKDLNIDGRPEILITTSDGGNCCAPEIKIIFFTSICDQTLFVFEAWDAVGEGWDNVEVTSVDGIAELRAFNDPYGAGGTDMLRSEVIYSFDGGDVSFVSKIKVLPLKSLLELRSSQFSNDNTESRIELKFDLNGDQIDETISCGYWDRWGTLTNCKISYGQGGVVIKDLGSTKRLGVLNTKSNGWHDLVSDYDDVYFYQDGRGYSLK